MGAWADMALASARRSASVLRTNASVLVPVPATIPLVNRPLLVA